MTAPPYYANARHDVIAMLPRRRYGQILEVGGGDFPTLHKLGLEHDAITWGVDVRRPDTAFDTFVEGSITDPAVVTRLPAEGFDLVIANDVVEHVADTNEFFRVLYSVTGAGGVAALSVPNIRQVRAAYQIFVCGTFPRNEAGLFDQTHLRWFCRRDVMGLAARAGFEIVDWRASGRLIPRILERSSIAEFLALQNLFILAKQ